MCVVGVVSFGVVVAFMRVIGLACMGWCVVSDLAWFWFVFGVVFGLVWFGLVWLG